MYQEESELSDYIKKYEESERNVENGEEGGRTEKKRVVEWCGIGRIFQGTICL